MKSNAASNSSRLRLPASIGSVLEIAGGPSPVVAIGASLRKTSALLKLAEAHGAALAHASYAPEGRDADRMVIELGRAEGLLIEPSVASTVAAACNSNQAIVGHELSKFA